MKNFWFPFLALAALPLAPLNSHAAETPERKPNIVFVLVDDLPYAGLSLTGNSWLETPSIDGLAKQGMFFTRAYSEVVCGPSRISIMTGQFAGRHGRTDNVPGVHPRALMLEPLLPAPAGGDAGKEFDEAAGDRLPSPLEPESYSLVKALKADGYRTALSGKWHMRKQHLTPAEARDYGFDFCNEKAQRGNPYKDSQRFTDDAIRFIRENRDQSFFVYLAYSAVHGPHIVPPEDKQRWAKRLEGKKPGINPDMLASLEFIDRSVGSVLDTLQELNLTDDTIVVFAGDNGGVCKKVHGEENQPLRLGKASLYEGGVRVPLILRWPGHIPPDSRCDVPVSLADLFPTLCEAAGTKLDPAHPLDGVSLRPLFSGGKIPDRTIFIHYPHYFATSGTTPTRVAIRDRYKLLWNPYDHVAIEGARVPPEGAGYVPKPRLELYDVQADPGEKVNLAEKMPDMVKELCRLYEAWMKEVGAKELAPNPDYDAKDPLFNERKAALGDAG